MPQLLAVKSAATILATPLEPVPVVPFTRTVPKELVHRAAIAEVLLTSWQRLDDTRFALTAQWPRGHSFYRSSDGVHHDSMLCAETVRQCGALLSHTEFGIPLGHHFLLSDLEYAVGVERLVVATTPAELELTVTCSEVRMRRGVLASMVYQVEIRRDGHLVGTGGARFTCTSPAVYQRLRSGLLKTAGRTGPLPAPVPAVTVGRHYATDVVLSAQDCGPGVWQLRADVRHPILFDHPGDHIPGMVLLEAARQIACTFHREAAVPSAVSSSFQRYVEFDEPCWLEGRADGGGTRTVHVTGRQNGEPVFSCSITAPVAPSSSPVPAAPADGAGR